MLKLALTVVPGVLFFHYYPGEDLGWLDSAYFTVISLASIGFGEITPATQAGRVFLIIWLLMGTLICAGSLTAIVGIWVRSQQRRVTEAVVKSTTFVYKADISGDGRVSEAEYVLFKLQQLGKVDPAAILELSDRFSELDSDGNGFLDVGKEVPRAPEAENGGSVDSRPSIDEHINALRRAQSSAFSV